MTNENAVAIASSNNYSPSMKEPTSKDDSATTGIAATAVAGAGGYVLYRKKKRNLEFYINKIDPPAGGPFVE